MPSRGTNIRPPAPEKITTPKAAASLPPGSTSKVRKSQRIATRTAAPASKPSKIIIASDLLQYTTQKSPKTFIKFGQAPNSPQQDPGLKSSEPVIEPNQPESFSFANSLKFIKENAFPALSKIAGSLVDSWLLEELEKQTKEVARLEQELERRKALVKSFNDFVQAKVQSGSIKPPKI